MNISHFTFTLLTLPPFASTLLFANPAVGNLASSLHVVLGHTRDCMRATTCSPISLGLPSSLPSHPATIVVFVCLSHVTLAAFHCILTNVFHAGQHCCLWSVSTSVTAGIIGRLIKSIACHIVSATRYVHMPRAEALKAQPCIHEELRPRGTLLLLDRWRRPAS